MHQDKSKRLNINNGRNESPFVLDLKQAPAFERRSNDFKPRKFVSYYYKLKSYFLLFFYGEKFYFAGAPHAKTKTIVDEFFPFRFFKTIFVFAGQILRYCRRIMIFIFETLRDIFAAKGEGIVCFEPSPLMIRPSFRRHITIFLLCLLAVSSPFGFVSLYNSLKTKAVFAEERSRKAINLLTNSELSDWGNLAFSIEQASKNFQLAYNDLQNINIFLKGVLDIMPGKRGKEYRTAKKILKAAQESTSVAPILKNAFEILKNEKDNLKRINAIEEALGVIEPKISVAFYNLNSVNTDVLPPEINSIFDSVKNYFYQAMRGLEETKNICEFLKEVLGNSEPKRYLLIFQNNNEIRATGGFMGSFAEISVYKGKITKTYFPGGGTYDLRGMLRKFVAPPEPLLLVNERWEFQDANWFPDFPSSAQKIIWFYENSGGPTIDGVIAINAKIVADLLALVGPIEMKDRGKIISAENFIDEVQYEVEIGYDRKENQPKKILAEMYPFILDKLSSAEGDNFIELLKIFGGALKNRDAQLYFANPKLQKRVLSYGIGGGIQSTSGDYLAIVHTNIAGGKTDGSISESAELKTKISENGAIINTLTVKRKHNGIKRLGFSGVRNIDYARIYVPKGSKLIEAQGFARPDEKFFKSPLAGLEVDKDLSRIEKIIDYDAASGIRIAEEFGKTVFGNWLMVEPGEEITYTVIYQIPMTFNFSARNFDTYSLLIQKQSGVNPIEFRHIIEIPEGIERFWGYPSAFASGNYSFVADKDLFFAAIYAKTISN